jgi:hypothetical protein
VICWQRLASPLITAELSLGKWLPKEADRSHDEYRDGYTWHWGNTSGWLFKKGPLEAGWSNVYTYPEAARIVRERVPPVGTPKHPDILVIYAPSPHHEAHVVLALFRVTSGALRGFDAIPPDWYTAVAKTRLDHLSEPIV